MLLASFLLASPLQALAAPWPDLSQAPQGAVEGQNDTAVIVAIEDYAEVEDVLGARQNAADWLRWFTRTRGIPAHRVFQALDRDAKDLRIRSLLDQAAAATPAGGTVWFVFIGHGAPSKDGKDGVLVGADADRSADGVYARSVPRSEVAERLGRGKQAHVVMVLDACFSGQGASGGSLVPGLQPLIPTALASASTSGLHVLSATGSGEFSGPLAGASRPAFSYLMLGALSGWGDGVSGSPDGKVSLQEARDWTAGALNLTVTGRTQTPQLVGEDLSVGKAWRKDAPDVVALASAPPAPPPPAPSAAAPSAGATRASSAPPLREGSLSGPWMGIVQDDPMLRQGLLGTVEAPGLGSFVAAPGCTAPKGPSARERLETLRVAETLARAAIARLSAVDVSTENTVLTQDVSVETTRADGKREREARVVSAFQTLTRERAAQLIRGARTVGTYSTDDGSLICALVVVQTNSAP
jgi:hypothetical protein